MNRKQRRILRKIRREQLEVMPVLLPSDGLIAMEPARIAGPDGKIHLYMNRDIERVSHHEFKERMSIDPSVDLNYASGWTYGIHTCLKIGGLIYVVRMIDAFTDDGVETMMEAGDAVDPKGFQLLE